MHGFVTDLHCALRRLVKAPGFVAIVLLTLALGIGVNTSMYTLVDVLFLRTVPFPEAQRMLSVIGTTPQNPHDGFSLVEADELRAEVTGGAKAFETLTAYAGWDNTLVLPDRPAEGLRSIDATADFFRTLGVQPMLGRAYTPDEEVPGRNRVVVLSYRTWQSRFGGDRNVIGRSIRLNAEPVTVIGVMPASFVAPLFLGPVDLFRPLTIPDQITHNRFQRFFSVVGRLNPGVTPEQARAQLLPVAVNWAKDYPQTNTGRGFRLLPPHKASMDDTSEFIVWLLFGLSTAVLIIACANIANLQLARAAGNIKDLAVRSALGASRGQLIANQLAEALLLAITGGILGLGVAIVVNHIFGNAIHIGDGGEVLNLPLNGRVALVAFAASLVCGVFFGLLPAWLISRGNVNGVLKQQARGSTSGRGARLVRNALIVGQVCVALAVLSVSGVMIRGLDAMMHRQVGWDTERLLQANIHLPEQSRYASDDKRRGVIDKLAQRLREIPGVEHTAIATSVPVFGYSKIVPLLIEGQAAEDPSKQPTAGYTMIASDYFATLGVPLREGHVFPAELKGGSPPVVIINESMARHFWPGQTAIGKRIGDRDGESTVWREVVGVAGDVEFALNVSNPPTNFQVYKPLVEEPWGYLFLLVRGPAPGAFKNEIRKAVADIDPDVSVQELYTMPEAADHYQRNLFVINRTLAAFALLGLVLAALGLYGVISYLVAQRTSEFGIRIALGASTGSVLRLVMRHGLMLAGIGVVLGIFAGFGLARLAASGMPRMITGDFATLATTALTLLIVASAACLVPAMRATRVNPLVALRAD